MRCFAALRTARKDECGSPGQHKKFDAFACSSATQAEPASFASVRRGLHASDAIAAGLALASSQCPRRFNFDLSCRVDPGLLPATSPYKAITVQTGIADRRGLAWSAFRFDRFRSSAGGAPLKANVNSPKWRVIPSGLRVSCAGRPHHPVCAPSSSRPSNGIRNSNSAVPAAYHARFLRPSFRSRRRSLGRCARSCEKACLLDHFFSGAVVAVPAPPGACTGFSFRSHAARARMTMHTPMSIPLISRLMSSSTWLGSPARPMPSSRPRPQRAATANLIRDPVRAQCVPVEGRNACQRGQDDIALHRRCDVVLHVWRERWALFRHFQPRRNDPCSAMKSTPSLGPIMDRF